MNKNDLLSLESSLLLPHHRQVTLSICYWAFSNVFETWEKAHCQLSEYSVKADVRTSCVFRVITVLV